MVRYQTAESGWLRADGCGSVVGAGPMVAGRWLVPATVGEKSREDTEFFFAGFLCSSFISFNN